VINDLENNLRNTSKKCCQIQLLFFPVPPDKFWVLKFMKQCTPCHFKTLIEGLKRFLDSLSLSKVLNYLKVGQFAIGLFQEEADGKGACYQAKQ